MNKFLIFALLLLQRSLSMELNSSIERLLKNDDTSSTENSFNDREFLEQLEKAKKDSINDVDSEKGFPEEWNEYNQYADYLNDNDIDINESQYEIQEVQKQQERDAEKEDSFKLAARERFPNVADKWFKKAFDRTGDVFLRENFLDALVKYDMAHEDVDYAFKIYGDKNACEYLDKVIADKILAAKLESQIGVIEKKMLLNEFGFQYNLKPSVHVKYFNLREHWVKKGYECEREFKRFLRDANIPDFFEDRKFFGKNMKALIGSFLEMEDRFNLALTSKTMLEDSELLGKHMFVCMKSQSDTAEIDAEFCPNNFKMVRLCIQGGQLDNELDAYKVSSIVLTLPDEKKEWHKYTIEGDIMIPGKGIKIEIFNNEKFNVDMSDLEKLKKNVSEKLVCKKEKMDGKTDQNAIVRIIFQKYFYFTRRESVWGDPYGRYNLDGLRTKLTTRQLLKLHFQK